MSSERDKLLIAAYASGEPMTSIFRRTGVSLSQLSRIFRAANIKRKKYELDLDFFEQNKGKTHRQISEETGLLLKRVIHLWKIAYNKRLSKGKTDFTGCSPSVDPSLLYNRDWLYDQYVVKNNGTPTIAKMLACKASNVIKQLKVLDIPIRSIKQASKLKEKRPDYEWLVEHYVQDKWSITKCAEEFGTGFNAVYTALVEFGIEVRNASEQHEGELNEFYGREHDPEVAKMCAEIGSKYGRQYWLTGDIQAKIDFASKVAKDVWADPDKRSQQSAKIAELCAKGGCNSKQILYIRDRDKKQFVFRSSWEYAIALCFDDNDMVADWEYEAISIPYEHDGNIKNFVVDFKVLWKNGLTTYVECKNEHLLKSEKEQKKIEVAKDFLRSNRSNLIVVKSLKDVRGAKIEYDKLCGNRYYCNKSYLKRSDWDKEVLIHELVERVCPWSNLSYTDVELKSDIRRLCDENIDLYKYKEQFRSTVPNKFGMPGRSLIINFQPHFLNVVINKRKPLVEAFNSKWVIYRSILRSMEEEESLTLERLLREINFHFTDFGRTSHFAAGFARSIIRHMGMSGKRMFDPCCGWGGRLIGAWLEGCEYSGTDISPFTCDGLNKINEYIGFNGQVMNSSCLDADWDGDFIMTSPPFYDIEEYIGGEQPRDRYADRNQWLKDFIDPFVTKIGQTPTALYLDKLTMDDYKKVRVFDDVLLVANRRHARQKNGEEYLCFYNVR